MKKTTCYECVIIGGGPGGLTAGYYMSRFLHKVCIFDNNQSRASSIPITYNIPGFSRGITGESLLKRLTKQYLCYKNPLFQYYVKQVDIENDRFRVHYDNQFVYAKKIILATGSEDYYPDDDKTEIHLHKDFIRQCPICDAYEYQGKAIAILGEADSALNKALFLYHFSKNITLYVNNREKCDPKLLKKVQQKNITIYSDDIKKISQKENDKITIEMNDGIKTYDVIYAAYGRKIKSNLAINLGAKQKDSCLLVDDHQQTSIPGIYAVGDIVSGLHQVVVAMGQAAIAAVDVHNSLTKEDIKN